jgi:hypothetical protein
MLASDPRNRYVQIMAKRVTKRRASPSRATTVFRLPHEGKTVKTRFGNVVVTGAEPSEAVVKANIDYGTQALERVAKRLLKPGVVLPSKKDVPRFSADGSEPGVLIRRLNGRVDRGRLVDGIFQVID